MRTGPSPSTLATGFLTGALAAAAVLGMLLGFGLRQGTPARPLNAIAGVLLGDRGGDIWGFHGVMTTVGVATVVASAVGWSMLFARVGRGLHGWRVGALAAAVALAALVVHVVAATQLRYVNVTDVLAPAEVIAVHVVLGVALGVGMRFATSYVWQE